MKGQYPVDETCSELTFSFWYALQEEVTSVDEEQKQATLLEIFRPYFERLIEVLISKGQLPENESIFTSEDKESFRCYRVDITDTMVKKKSRRTRRSDATRLPFPDVYAQRFVHSCDRRWVKRSNAVSYRRRFSLQF